MARLDTERQERLEPVRMAHAIEQISRRGFEITYRDENQIRFLYRGSMVSFFPYSGWATGKTIADGRGLKNLLRQLDYGKKL